jgi:hypothetical protein
MGESTTRRAARYEALYPETGVSKEQAAERMDRIDHKAEKAAHVRTGRTRGIVVPSLPWKEQE